ncbi:hypothetical protein GA0070622_1770 [Micromonospora sediminicola]|uniref:DUF4878 domain-containing protein n=1 Tax=Micromonospora sediminicola TaxID=946078 RepID=A0A1A9B6R9_9ACTN|nr:MULTISPECIES: hypothetical protein [Micromonospora]PGH42411.1 hypothetical protein COO58_22255 [Micromonospora sp. WMMA1996]SBT64791.1 hypothetical protein GA0070622_1770 [Micromonospora sediminicola]
MAYEPAMVPPKKSRRTLFIVLGVVLALCCSGGVVGGFVLYRVAQDATGPARATVDTFAGAIVARDYPAAYRLFCADVRDRLGEADFARQQSAQPELTGYEIVGLNVTNNNGRVRGSANVRFTPRDGVAVNQVLPLVKEDGDWRICD